MKILIVDDSAFMRAIIKNMFSKKGYKDIYEASNPFQALKLYKEVRPDIVTMDIVMETSGIECIKNIKKIDNNANIIISSSMGAKPYVLEGLKAGAIDFLIKPYNDKRLQEALDKICIKNKSVSNG